MLTPHVSERTGERKRIVFVTPWLPSRVRPRARAILQELTKEHDVWLLASDSDDALGDLGALSLAGLTVVPAPGRRDQMRAVASILGRRSLQVALMSTAAARRALRDLCSQWHPDVVHFNVVRTAGLLGEVPDAVPVVFDLDDIRSDFYRQLRDKRSLRSRVLGLLETARLVRAERDVYRRSRTVLLSSPQDVGRFGSNDVVLRTPIELHEYRAVVPVRSERPVVTFVGRLGYVANQDALEWFLRNVWTKAREALPTAELHIVGENPGDRYKSDENLGIKVTGFVPSVLPYYASTTVAIVPVSLATGVQMKLLQALAAGAPTITTSRCAELAGVDTTSTLVADTAAEWVHALTTLAGDAELRERLTRHGRAWVDATYPDGLVRDALARAYDKEPDDVRSAG